MKSIRPASLAVLFAYGTLAIALASAQSNPAARPSKAKTYTIKASYPGDAFRKASSGTVKQVVSP